MSKVVPKALRPPKMGSKQIFLPNFVLTLLRTPALPPTFASFYVPLNFNKLDLRDYLYNGYNIRVNAVRSYIQMQKLRQDKPGAKRPSPRKWFRPRSIKKMTVELEQPFVWPAEPTDYEKWDKVTYDAANKDRDAQESVHKPDYREQPTKERKSIAEQARQSLEETAEQRRKDVKRVRGKAAMAARRKVQEKKIEADGMWEDVGSEIEVEKEQQLPRIGEEDRPARKI